MQGRDSKGAPQRRLRWLLVLAAAGLVAALVLSACGSSNKSSTTAATSGGATTAAAAAKPTGTPITTYTFADVNTEGPQYKNIEETARVYSRNGSTPTAASRATRSRSKFCDAKGTPTAATACARKAVADHAVAVVGIFTFTGDAILPMLEAGHVGLLRQLLPDLAEGIHQHRLASRWATSRSTRSASSSARCRTAASTSRA